MRIRTHRSLLAALLSGFVWFLLGPGFVSCSQPEAKPEGADASASQTVLEVRFAEARKTSVRRAITTIGTLEAAETITVSNEVAGRIEEIFHDVGDYVDKGSILIELNKRELVIQRDRAEAALDEVLARVGAADANDLPPVEEVSEVRQARALLEDAERKLSRTRDLFQRGVVSQSQLDDAETTLEVARTRHQATTDQTRNELVSVRSYRAALDLAEKKLQDATVRAPLSGFVQQRLVSPGEYVKENSPVFTLVQAQKLKLVAEVPEREAAALHVGLPMTFNVDAFPGHDFEARITRIAPAVDQQTRTFLIEAAVSNPGVTGNRLRPGFFARIRIHAEPQEVVLVPSEALYILSGVKKVFVRNGEVVEARTVETGSEEDQSVEITSGVQAGELVAVNHLADLSDGQRVKAVPVESES